MSERVLFAVCGIRRLPRWHPLNYSIFAIAFSMLGGCSDLFQAVSIQAQPPANATTEIGNSLAAVDHSPVPSPQEPPEQGKPITVPQARDIQSLVAKYNNSTPSDKTMYRNDIAYAIMFKDDIDFQNYATSLWLVNSGTSVVGDFIGLGLTGAGAVSGSSANALSAAATAVSGAKTALSKDILESQTIASLVFSMTLTRAQIRNHIQTCLALPDSQYGLSAALYDLSTYHQAMVLPLAIAITTSTAVTPPSQTTCGPTAAPSLTLPPNLSLAFSVPSTSPSMGDVAKELANQVGQDPGFRLAGIAVTIPASTEMDFSSVALQYSWAFLSIGAAAAPAAPAAVASETATFDLRLTFSGTFAAGDTISIKATPIGAAAAVQQYQYPVTLADVKGAVGTDPLTTVANNIKTHFTITPIPGLTVSQSGPTVDFSGSTMSYTWVVSKLSTNGDVTAMLNLQLTGTATKGDQIIMEGVLPTSH